MSIRCIWLAITLFWILDMATTKKKKTTTNNTMRLSAKEKELIKNYRKCNTFEKDLIWNLCEKVSGNLLDTLSDIQNLTKDEK